MAKNLKVHLEINLKSALIKLYLDPGRVLILNEANFARPK